MYHLFSFAENFICLITRGGDKNLDNNNNSLVKNNLYNNNFDKIKLTKLNWIMDNIICRLLSLEITGHILLKKFKTTSTIISATEKLTP